jgi:hydroxymethylbilane synthase
VIRIGTRGSRLARWQSDWVAARLREAWPELVIEIVEIRTQGDRDQTSGLSGMGGVGVFVKEIQKALRAGAVDVAVHSLKDLPSQEAPGLILGAVPERESVLDCLIAPGSQSLGGLRPGSRIGTSSPRRRAMLLRRRPDLRVELIRGNVETRIQRALGGDFDAVVLAHAGLKRIGLEEHVTEYLGPPDFLPAVGQGALGVECRADDDHARGILAALHHAASGAGVAAERAVMRVLQGGCSIALGAWGRVERERLILDVRVLDAEGKTQLDARGEGTIGEAATVGEGVARQLEERGAHALLRQG